MFNPDQLPRKNEAAEINPELVEQVENCQLPLEDKINLLLVKGGLKPSALIGLVLKNKENQFVSDGELAKINDVLTQSGVPFLAGEKKFSV